MDFIPLYFLFAFLLLSLWVYLKKGTGKLFVFIIAIYLVSSFFSIVYANTDFFIFAWKQQYELTFIPFVYWLLCFFILALPIMKYDKLRVTKVIIPMNVVYFICYLSLLLSIVPFIELFPSLKDVFSNSDLASTFSDIHDDNEKTLPLSFVGRQCYRLLRYMYLPTLLCMIPVLTGKKKMLPLLGIGLSMAVVIIAALLLSTRGIIFATIIYVSLMIVMYYPLLKKNEISRIIRFLVIIMSIVFIAFFTITIYRNIYHQDSMNDYSLVVFLARYAGEGFINFNQYFGHILDFTNGDYCFYVLKKLIGMDMPTVDRDYIMSVVSSHVGIPMMVFYTFIGFFVIDIGYVGTIIFFIIVSLLVKNEMKIINGTIYFHQLFLIFIYVAIIADGTCVYRYSWNTSAQLLVMILLYFLLKILERAKK